MDKKIRIQKKFPPVIKDYAFLHGADYNPDQWLKYPDILEEDISLMKLAGINCVSIGIFAWSALEPRENVFTFDWLDKVMDKLNQAGIGAILATPSAARPAWLGKKYPQTISMESNRVRNLHGTRVKMCWSSPVLREKVQIINTKLAERYKNHPALKMWHISNEYSGECHCPLCQDNFRKYLKAKYNNSITDLNDAWWTSFWSHKFNSFDQIESPAQHGENLIHGLNLDWKRFTSSQIIDFMKKEAEPLKLFTDVPVTTNMMEFFDGINYFEMAKHIDIASWDSYPRWHNINRKTWEEAADTSMMHDLVRSLKGGKPFMLMESTPSLVNWQEFNKLKRPGMHSLSSLEAIAHGSDSVQYFQWRKSRGCSEKFHGAVVDHAGGENTRVFREVSDLGRTLDRISEIAGSVVPAKVALIYDWENKWAINDIQGLSKNKDYNATCAEHYRQFWKKGVNVDIIDMQCPFDKYNVIVAPMLYLLRENVADRLKLFAYDGGIVILTYLSGYVNENDLCFLGGFPGDGLGQLAGIWAEEIDTLYPGEKNGLVCCANEEGIKGWFETFDFAELVHENEGCEVMARFTGDFYKGYPALTKNKYGKGACYYFAARTDEEFLNEFYGKLIDYYELSETEIDVPCGVSVSTRSVGGMDFTFILNFTEEAVGIRLPEGKKYINLITGAYTKNLLELPVYSSAVLKPI